MLIGTLKSFSSCVCVCVCVCVFHCIIICSSHEESFYIHSHGSQATCLLVIVTRGKSLTFEKVCNGSLGDIYTWSKAFVVDLWPREWVIILLLFVHQSAERKYIFIQIHNKRIFKKAIVKIKERKMWDRRKEKKMNWLRETNQESMSWNIQ